MKKTGIFYGSSTGTTQSIAETIASKLGIAATNVIDVAKMTAEQIKGFDALILGTSTWGDGELQDDWYDGIKLLKAADLSGKTIALFGCGDSESYSDTFCDGIGLIYEEIKDSGCSFIGQVSTDGYTFSSSASVVDGVFVGLAIDDVNESDQTENRINAWVEKMRSSLV